MSQYKISRHFYGVLSSLEIEGNKNSFLRITRRRRMAGTGNYIDWGGLRTMSKFYWFHNKGQPQPVLIMYFVFLKFVCFPRQMKISTWRDWWKFGQIRKDSQSSTYENKETYFTLNNKTSLRSWKMAIKNQKKGNQELNKHAFSQEGFSNKKDGVACQKFWKKTVRGAKILFFFLNCGVA